MKSYLVHYINHSLYSAIVFQNLKDESDSELFELNKDNDVKSFLKFINKIRSEQNPLIGYQMIDVVTQIFRMYTTSNGITSPYSNIRNFEDRYYNDQEPVFVNDPGSVKLWNVYDISRIKNLNRVHLEQLKCIKNFNNVSTYISLKNVVTDHDSMTLQIALMKDIKFIKELWNSCLTQMKFNNALSKKYSIDLKNNTHTGMIKRISLNVIASKSNVVPHDIIMQQTNISNYECKKLLFKKYGYKTQQFKNVSQYIEDLVIKNNNLDVNHKITYNGIVFNYHKSGVNASRPGVYNTNKHYSIYSIDVKNFFASMVLNHKYAPNHLSKQAYLETLSEYVKMRNKDGVAEEQKTFFKKAIVGLIGLSNAKGFSRDPSFYFKTTLNGIMIMNQLIETIIENNMGSKILKAQIDGLDVIIPKENEESFKKVLKWFIKTHKLELHVKKVKSMIISNVLNYAVLNMPIEFQEGMSTQDCVIKTINDKQYLFKVDSKGMFREDEDNESGSFKIIPKVLKDYFFQKIMPEDSIMSNRNIFDFTGFVTAKKHFDFVVDKKEMYETIIRYYKIKKDAEGAIKIFRKNVHNGLSKIQSKGSECIASIINPTTPLDMYDIDYEYYLSEIKLEISKLNRNDL